METTTMEIVQKGMDCLMDSLGVIDTERFIAFLLRERFDYTKWQRDYFDKRPDAEFMNHAVEYANAHPYKGNAKKIIE